MACIDLYGNPTLTSHIDHLRRFIDALVRAADGITLRAESSYLDFLHTVAPHSACAIKRLNPSYRGEEPALVLSIGGDGTFLTTANRVAPTPAPVMGINAGHLGYLSATDIARADILAKHIVTGRYVTEPRNLIAVSADTPLMPMRPWALNEVAFLRQDTASMITVEARVNGQFLASYSGDGLIVSTPTGSTGYNLSVGGPLMSPRCKNWVISPIAPHSLSMRPLVLPDDVNLEITAHSRSGSMMLAIDGRPTPLPVNTVFTLIKAPFAVNVAQLEGHSFVNTLRHKLHWGAE